MRRVSYFLITNIAVLNALGTVLRLLGIEPHLIRYGIDYPSFLIFGAICGRSGVRHIYIKSRSPNLNGKVERSHSTDEQEFYQLLTYTDAVDSNKELAECEKYYNFDGPRCGLNEKTPYETLRKKLQ